MKLRHTVLLSAALLVAGPALAQDDGLKPLDPEGIRDMGGWLGEDEVPEESPPGALESDPLAEPAAPAPQELSPEEKRRRSRQIDRNYKQAQDIYQGIINADKVAPLDRRIANNERIVKEYNARIRGALRERRELQVNVFNQSFYLKQQVDKGLLAQDAYDGMITQEEEKYETRVASLKTSVTAWRKEVRAAKKRLATLKAQRRMLIARRPRIKRRRSSKRGERGPKLRPGERLLSSLRQRLKKLHTFETRNTLAGVHPRDLGSAPSITRDAPSLDDDSDSDEVPEEDEGFWDD